jgi:GWxTD domain-containing protein
MPMNLRATLAFLLFLFGLTIPVLAQWDFPSEPDKRQRSGQGTPLYDQSPTVYFEALNFPSAEPGASRLDILYRVSHAFFVFARNNDPNPPAPFRARADITIEVFNNDDVSVARELSHASIDAATSVSNPADMKFLEGMASFDLPPGEYKLVTEVNDLESNRRYFDNNRRITVKPFAGSDLDVSDLMFVQMLERDSAKVALPLNFGGDVPFGHSFDAYCEIVANVPPESLHVGYALYRHRSAPDRRDTLLRDSIVAGDIAVPNTMTVRGKGQQRRYEIVPTHPSRTIGCWIGIRGDTLNQGVYDLEVAIASGSSNQMLRKRFQVRWINMPQSLRNLDVAVRALEYIATDEEFKRIRSASGKWQREYFEEFWKQRDPTPATAFNELMAEYYRRVDYAYVAFATLKQPNGLQTDRGRTYAIYGPPTRIERDFSPLGPPRELWYYEGQKKKFTFVDERRSGDYRMLALEPM